MLIFLGFNARGQNIIQDNKGQTSLSLNPGSNKSDKDSAKLETPAFNLGQIKIATAEKKLELNHYQYFRKNRKPPSFLGISVAGKIENSLTSLFASGDIAPGTDIKIKYGVRLFKRKIADYDSWESEFIRKHGRKPTGAEQAVFSRGFSTASDLWFVTNAGFVGSKFKLFHADSSYGKQLEKVNFSSPQLHIGLNFWTSDIFNCVTLVGTTIGIKTSNNFDDLTESTSEEVTVRTNPGDSSTRKITEKNTIFKGAYKETTCYPLNLDIYFKPHKFENVAFLLFAHHEIFKNEKPQSRIGGGFYFLRKNNLFDPVFGINVDFKDVFNNDVSDNSKRDFSKLSIGIVTDLNTLLFQKRK